MVYPGISSTSKQARVELFEGHFSVFEFSSAVKICEISKLFGDLAVTKESRGIFLGVQWPNGM